MTHKAVLGAGSSQLARERVRIQQSQQTSPTQGPQTPKAVDVFLASDAAKDVAADVVAGALAGRFDAIPWIPKIDFAGL